MKRERTVFKDHEEVCHVWAQQKQTEGRASRVFFDGASIFSYGRHFEMARFITPDIVFITTATYSVSTAKHLRMVRQAVSHKTVFEVPSMFEHNQNVEHYIKLIRKLDGEVMRSVKYAQETLREMRGVEDIVAKYLNIFGKHVGVVVKRDLRKLLKEVDAKGRYDKVLACNKRILDAQAERYEARRQRQIILDREKAERWLAGESREKLGYFQTDGVLLRVKEDMIETSQGARVPVREALTLYAMLKTGAPVHGMVIGNYNVTSYDGSILRVGCHEIRLAEMDRVAKLIPQMEVSA